MTYRYTNIQFRISVYGNKNDKPQIRGKGRHQGLRRKR